MLSAAVNSIVHSISWTNVKQRSSATDPGLSQDVTKLIARGMWSHRQWLVTFLSVPVSKTIT